MVPECGVAHAFSRYADEELAAPPIMWPEVRSTLHRSVWRRMVSADAGLRALGRLQASPVQVRDRADLGPTAWEIADRLGWAKTYDAEYFALAALLGCPLVTFDGRLRRAAERIGVALSEP